MTSKKEFPVELDGGPHDGAVIHVPYIPAEILFPDADAAEKKLHSEEASFNMSMHGQPYSEGVMYHRYECTGRTCLTDVVVSGKRFHNITVMLFSYTGKVGRRKSDGPATIL